MTVAVLVTDPRLFVAVRVYVVVWVGETVIDERLETSPTPLSIVRVGAGFPVVAHDRVAD